MGQEIESATAPKMEQDVEVNNVDLAGTIGEVNAAHFPGKALRRNIGPFTAVAVGFNIVNAMVGIGSSLAIAVAAGGTVTIIYGVIVAGFAYICVGASLGEMASVFPSSGGQYHFASILASPKRSRGISYICGMISIFSWVAICAAATILMAEAVLAIPAFFVQGYNPATWHYFLVYQAVNVVYLLNNIFFLKRAPWMHDVGLILAILGFLVVTITCLAIGPKQSSSHVWTDFENSTGWSDGVTFITGLTTPCLMYAGIDAILHLAEEVTEPRRAVPRALMTTVGVGFSTGFVFAVAMCYCIQDLDALLDTPMPIYTLWREATKSDAAGTVFQVCLALNLGFVANASQQTTSRLLWAFGRDNGFIFSKIFSALSPRLEVPVWCLLINAFWVLVFGCIYLGSSTAFNAILNSCIILQMVSFAIPCALLLLRRRSSVVLPETRAFKLRGALGWIANTVVIITAIIQVVFFSFPPAIPVTGTSMNYAVVVFAIMALLAVANWFLHANKHYSAPIIEYLQ